MTDDRLYLQHIIDSVERVRRYTAAGHAAFLADDMQQDAVVRNLQTLAESTQRLSESIKAQHPEVDWRLIARFRNVVVHQYLGLNIERVWSVVDQHLDPLD